MPRSASSVPSGSQRRSRSAAGPAGRAGRRHERRAAGHRAGADRGVRRVLAPGRRLRRAARHGRGRRRTDHRHGDPADDDARQQPPRPAARRRLRRPHVHDHRLAALAAALGRRRPRHHGGGDRLRAHAMSAMLHPALSNADLLGLFAHFLVLSLLAIGGAITTAPDMHRYVVDEHHWISDAQFSASIAIAQAAPGPNVLFVAVIGWNVAGPVGALATMAGTMLPSTALTLIATRWGQRRRDTRFVRAFKTGITPLTIGLLVATGWLLALG